MTKGFASYLDLERIPSHVSIIMDGNGRWAKARGLERSEGHVAGVDSLREAVTTQIGRASCRERV